MSASEELNSRDISFIVEFTIDESSADMKLPSIMTTTVLIRGSPPQSKALPDGVRSIRCTPEVDQIFRQPVAKPSFWLLGPGVGGLWGLGAMIAAGIGLSGRKRLNFHKMQRYERAVKWRKSRYFYFNTPTSI
jgi:hypothetical protein